MKHSVLMMQKKKVIVFQPWQNVLKSIDLISFDVRRVNCAPREIEWTHNIRVVFALNRRIWNENDQKLKPIEKVELIIMLLWIHRTIDNHHIDAVYLHIGCTVAGACTRALWIACNARCDVFSSTSTLNGQCEHVNSFHLICSLDHLIRSLWTRAPYSYLLWLLFISKSIQY